MAIVEDVTNEDAGLEREVIPLRDLLLRLQLPEEVLSNPMGGHGELE
jgi:hypothetical protein